MMRVRLLALAILALYAWFVIVLPGVGCNSGVGQTTGGDGGGGYYCDSCCYAGFSEYDVDVIYDAVIDDWYYGISYYTEYDDGEYLCDSYCPIYDDVCYSDCLNCVYDIIDDVYLYKRVELPAPKLDVGECRLLDVISQIKRE